MKKIHEFNKLVFSLAPNSMDLEAIKRAQPSHILISFSRWANKDIQRDLIDRIGYRPKTIIVDSGAFTFAYSKTRRKSADEIGILRTGCTTKEELRSKIAQAPQPGEPIFIKYLRWLDRNRNCIDHAFVMDIIGDPFQSMQAFKMMKSLSIPVIAIYHLGTPACYLETYLRMCSEIIALGGAAVRETGRAASINGRADWAIQYIGKFSWIKFHMMGTIDLRLLDKLPGLYSADGSAWIKQGDLQATVREIHKKESLNLKANI